MSAATTPSGVPSRTAVTSESVAPDTSTPAWAGWITWIARVLASVSGTPAYAGTAEIAETPGTISNGTSALRQATASSARPLKVAASPSMSRTTRRADLAALTTSLARVARVSGWPSSPKPASRTSTSGRA